MPSIMVREGNTTAEILAQASSMNADLIVIWIDNTARRSRGHLSGAYAPRQVIRDPTRNEINVRPVQISFRNMRVSPEIEEEIRSRVAWLESFHPAIVGCRVLLEVPHRHRRHGRPLHVRIEVSLPGEDVVVNHEPAADATDAHVVIHEAFDVARRRLEDMARQQRGDVKTRAAAT